MSVYQLLAYCTARRCREGVLIYPASELSGAEAQVSVQQSEISVRQLIVDLGVTGIVWEAGSRTLSVA